MSRSDPQLIIPFAKPSGITSFTSLWQVKRALGTKKVGHTGTLDSFADGLLILLSGKLTKLVPYITDFDKTYLVRFYFGKETDTLDPEGTVIDEKPLPLYSEFVTAVERFIGSIEQLPPVYSAVKQGGERLSDKIRRGETVTVHPRTVTIYDIIIEEIFYDTDTTHAACSAAAHDKTVAGAVLQVRCSKGTYIRSLVRDIAQACGSAAYKQLGLRRFLRLPAVRSTGMRPPIQPVKLRQRKFRTKCWNRLPSRLVNRLRMLCAFRRQSSKLNIALHL